MFKKIGLGIALFGLFSVPLYSSALTTEELQTKIDALLKQLASLQAQISAQPATPQAVLPDDYGTGLSRPFSCPRITLTLSRGSNDFSTGGQVSELQAYLANRYNLNEEDIVTGYFGKTTESYVIKFQDEQSLPSVGIAGSLTRAKITGLCGDAPPIACPMIAYQMPICATGEHVEKRSNPNGCEAAPVCVPDSVGKPIACPAIAYQIPLCRAGEHVEKRYTTSGCDTAPVCVPDTTSSKLLSGAPSIGAAPLTVVFETKIGGLRLSNPSYVIDFGDGSSEAAADCYAPTDFCITPGKNVHTYKSVGTYTAKLIKRTGNTCASTPDLACAAWASRDEVIGTQSVTVVGGSGGGGPSISGISGPTALGTGQAGTWTVNAADPANGNLSYSVLWGDESAFDAIANMASMTIAPIPTQTATFSHTYSRAGTYMPRFSVKNASGKSAESSISVNVGGTIAPTGALKATPSDGIAPLSVSFSGDTGSGCNGGYFRLHFGDGESTMIAFPADACRGTFSANHTYTASGVYTAKLTTDTGCRDLIFGAAMCIESNEKVIGSATVSVAGTVGGRCPMVVFQRPLCNAGEHIENPYDQNGCAMAPVCVPDKSTSLTATPASGTAPVTVTFRGYAQGLGKYSVNFGDGTSADVSTGAGTCAYRSGSEDSACNGGPNLLTTHTYTAPGTYTVSLISNDSCAMPYSAAAVLATSPRWCGPETVATTQVVVTKSNAQAGSIIVSGGQVPLAKTGIGMQTQNALLGSYVFSAGSTENVSIQKFRFTIRAVGGSSSSEAATEIRNLKIVTPQTACPVNTVSSGLYSIYEMAGGCAIKIPAGSSMGVSVYGDIGTSRGGSIDLWSDKGDFSFIGASTGLTIVPTSPNTTNDNNFYWSGWIFLNNSSNPGVAAAASADYTSMLDMLEMALKSLLGKVGN